MQLDTGKNLLGQLKCGKLLVCASFVHCSYRGLNLSVQMHLEIIKHGKTEYHMFFTPFFYDRIIGVGGGLRSLVYSIEQALS